MDKHGVTDVKIQCAASNDDLCAILASSVDSSKSAHLHRVTLALVTVPKSNVLPQMVICVLFTPAA